MADARRGEVLSFLVHASSKVGKTTLAGTCPKPLLLLDAEGGSKFLPYSRITWDPMQPPPAYDGTWEICVVHVHHFETLALVYQWLITGQHQFQSVCIDSITEVQRRCKENLVGTEQMKIQDWGTLLTKMEHLIRSYRDLTLHPQHPIQVAMFIAETRMVEGKWRPYMQGALATSLPYLVDVLGYLFVVDVPNELDPTAAPIKQRQLLVSPDPTFEAGERVQGRLGTVVAEPNVATMVEMVYPQATPQQGATS